MIARPLILAAAGLALAPAAAAHAAAPWSAPQSLSSSVTTVGRTPAVLAAGAGDTIVAFGVGFAIESGTSVFNLAIARRPAGAAAFGPRLRTTTRYNAVRVLPYARSRLIAISQGTRAVSELRVRFGSTDGTLGSVRRVAPGENVLRYAAAANARGDAVIAFVSQRPARSVGTPRRIVMVARRSAGGAFGRPETIVGRGRVNNVATAINAAGDIVVAYDQQGSVRTRSRRAGRSWQAVDEVNPRGVKGAQLRLALADGGRAVLGIFEQELTEGGDHGPANVLAAVREPGHHFRSPQLVETFPERFPAAGSQFGVAEVALDGDGAVLAWTGRVGAGFGVRVAKLAGTRFGPARDVSPAGQQLGGLAVGDGGRATVAWSPVFADPPLPSATIGAAVRAPGAAEFGPAELVSDVETAAGEASVGYAPRGGAPTIAWVASTGGRGSVVRVATRAAP